MNLATLTIQKSTLRRALHDLEAIKVTCNQCIYFHDSICGKFDAAPPAEWVGRGPVECEFWEFDGIPF